VPNADRILILGYDFNINVVLLNLMVKQFLQTIDSFNLTQSVLGSTHKQGDTLDLILSYGFSVSNAVKDFFSV